LFDKELEDRQAETPPAPFSRSLNIAPGPGHTERRVPHDNEKTRPLLLLKSFQGANYGQMYLFSIWLAQSHDYDTGVRYRAVLGEAAVRSDENPSPSLRGIPEVGILRSLFGRSTYV
jgi:hypothetical protein